MKFPRGGVRYTSFDGGVSIDTACREPDRYSFWDGIRDSTQPMIPRGGGFSYAAASFSSSAITTEHHRFNRILAFSPEKQTLTAEAGMTLGELQAFLTPKGFYLSVQPGHPKITLGGCIGADVHGKNQFRDGTFITRINSIDLFHPTYGRLLLSPEKDAGIFKLTCGGYGLTGDILNVELKVTPIPSGPSAYIKMNRTLLPDIGSLPDALIEASKRADLVYTWHDFTASGKSFGRGFLNEGRFATAEECTQRPAPQAKRRVSKLSAENRGNWGLPFFNGLTAAPFNQFYHMAQRLSSSEGLVSLYEFLFPVHNKEAYFKLFGRAGFMEYQVVVPLAGFNEYIDAIRARLRTRSCPVTLASAKLFAGKQDLLRFTGEGICLALNFPRSSAGNAFAAFLDELLPKAGAIPNIIKDSRLPAKVVAATYPQYGLFKERLAAFDPKRIYRSELSERLKL